MDLTVRIGATSVDRLKDDSAGHKVILQMDAQLFGLTRQWVDDGVDTGWIEVR